MELAQNRKKSLILGIYISLLRLRTKIQASCKKRSQIVVLIRRDHKSVLGIALSLTLTYLSRDTFPENQE